MGSTVSISQTKNLSLREGKRHAWGNTASGTEGPGELPFPLGTLLPEGQVCQLQAEAVTDLSQVTFARVKRAAVEAPVHAICPEGKPALLVPLHGLGTGTPVASAVLHTMTIVDQNDSLQSGYPSDRFLGWCS